MNEKEVAYGSRQYTHDEIHSIIERVNDAALTQLGFLCSRWFPTGRRRGNEYLALNPHRDDRHLGSFSINLSTGRWADFASGDRGRDPVSLYAFLERCRNFEAARRLSSDLGIAL